MIGTAASLVRFTYSRIVNLTTPLVSKLPRLLNVRPILSCHGMYQTLCDRGVFLKHASFT